MMRLQTKKFLSLLVLGATALSCLAKPLMNLQVTLRGHKYEISDVETVEDLQNTLQKTSGVDPKQQGRVLFGGKRLSPTLKLDEAGVTDGSTLNIVPGKQKTSTTSSSKPATPAVTASPSSSTESKSNDLGLDKEQLDEFMKSMGGSPDGRPPNMEESMEMMKSMMNSDIFQEYMSDPEKLEQSRQMILQNPLLKSMMVGMPGMEQVLEDPNAWREAMQAAASLYKNMDPNDLMKAMMGDGAGLPAGMFDGSLDTTPMAALDELSEGDD